MTEPRTLLFIDGDADLAAAVREHGAKGGFEVLVSDDGEQAMAAARQRPPSAIVLCAELPGLSGYTLCNKLGRDRTLGQIPLVLTSAEATAETFEQHAKLKTRADAYLLKPFTVDELFEAVKGAIAGRPAAAPAPRRSEREVSFAVASGDPAPPATQRGNPLIWVVVGLLVLVGALLLMLLQRG